MKTRQIWTGGGQSIKRMSNGTGGADPDQTGVSKGT